MPAACVSWGGTGFAYNLAMETPSGATMKRSKAVLAGFAALLALLATLFVARSAAAQDRPDPEKGDAPDPKLMVPSVAEPDAVLDDQAEKRPGVVAVLPGSGGYL